MDHRILRFLTVTTLSKGAYLQHQLIIAVYKFTLNQNEKMNIILLAHQYYVTRRTGLGQVVRFPTVSDIFKPGGKYEYSNSSKS